MKHPPLPFALKTNKPDDTSVAITWNTFSALTKNPISSFMNATKSTLFVRVFVKKYQRVDEDGRAILPHRKIRFVPRSWTPAIWTRLPQWFLVWHGQRSRENNSSFHMCPTGWEFASPFGLTHFHLSSPVCSWLSGCMNRGYGGKCVAIHGLGTSSLNVDDYILCKKDTVLTRCGSRLSTRCG